MISDWHKECLLDGDILAALYPSLDQTVFLTVYSKPFPGVDKEAVAASLQETAALLCFHLSLYVVFIYYLFVYRVRASRHTAHAYTTKRLVFEIIAPIL